MPSTREQSKQGNSALTQSLQEEFNKKLFLLPESNSQQLVQIIKLKHPKTESPAHFHVIKEENSRVLKINELLQFSEEYRSWFLDDFVVSDGSFMMSSPLHPIYLVLPYLQQYASKSFIPFEDIFIDQDYPSLKYLQQTDLRQSIVNVCDEKVMSSESGAKVYYRFSDDKAFVWLKNQIFKLVEILKIDGDLNETVTSCGETLKKLAWNILSEYLSANVSLSLKQLLNISDNVKRDSDAADSTSGIPLSKKSKSLAEPLEDYCSNEHSPYFSKKKENLSISQKRLAKAGESCKTLTTFFNKKK